ncbi:MAG: TIGR01458 family HAD-type hydrolase [candidate division Zixibacteria bacterium]|nr:TIGR01458 family HAD-type hydrolase [candidate division Zixibacteria bacterium]
MKSILSEISGLLLDLDGVVYVGERVLEGAVETVQYLKDRNIPCRFTTNTTVSSAATLHHKLTGMGLPVAEEEIFSALKATVRYLRARGRPSCYLLLAEDPVRDFAEFPVSDTKPDFVIIGDVGKYWDYKLINKVFRMVMSGSKMIALHKGKYWQTEAGLQVDMGAFVAGLEYVTGQEATVIGKPSPSFFKLALDDLGLPVERVAMVGDDIDSDIGGAQAVGLKGVLVKTGKYRKELVENSAVKPDLVIDSIYSLIDFC